MGQTIDEVIEQFRRGEPASNHGLASIPVAYDVTILVGYAHAIYAIREGNGDIVRFPDWSSRSRTSAEHLRKLGTGDTEDVDDVRPTTGDCLEVYV